MLDFGVKKNVWEPPIISNEQYEEYMNSIPVSPEGYLFIYQIEPYIDSFYVKMNRDNEFELVKRFTFKNGYCWAYEDEEFFVEKCLINPNCGYAYSQFENVFTYYSVQYPDWKLKRYYTKPFKLLDHIYHCMRKNSAKEMLYKAGIDELAANIDIMDEMNLLALKPSDIYDGLSMRILRALNCREGAILLASKYNRQFLKKLQGAFPNIFEEQMNEAQCRYLNYLIAGDLTVGEVGRLFTARYNALLGIWNDELYKMFIYKSKSKEQARQILKELNKIDRIYSDNIDLKLNTNEDVGNDIFELERYLLRDREEYDKIFRRSNRKRDQSWQERGQGYVVRYPQTINDFCREAIYMHNCLLTYVDAYINNVTTVLFVRNENDVNAPFITMEIFDNELMQAYHRYNRDCNDDEAYWIRNYCRRHGIGIDKFHFDAEVDVLF